jgi:hypothetical protein
MFEWYTLSVALFAAIGTLLFGFDTGIATTTIAQQSWVEYMGHPSNGLTGAVVALYVSLYPVSQISLLYQIQKSTAQVNSLALITDCGRSHWFPGPECHR